MSHLQSAFDAVCRDAKQPSGYYVVLLCEVQAYLGPEEGGCYGTDTYVQAYQWFETEEAAQAALTAVEKLAEVLTNDARREHGEQCLREMDWLDERGLDADWLPEPDGPGEYRVILSDHLPTSQRASREYS